MASTSYHALAALVGTAMPGKVSPLPGTFPVRSNVAEWAKALHCQQIRLGSTGRPQM